MTNENKINFLLEYFFKNEKYPDWRSIAYNLVTKGKCIVSGEECIWKGGIGNFIKTEPLKEAWKCSEYTFDVIDFTKNSAWFKEIKEQYEKILEQEKEQLTKELNKKIIQIYDITNF